MEGERDVLGLWVGPAGGEGAKFWMSVLTELRNRGVQDAFIVCCDGLKGLPDAIRATWPQADVQLCVVHLVRSSLRFTSKKYWGPICREMREIYTAPTVEAAQARFDEFADTWALKARRVSELTRTIDVVESAFEVGGVRAEGPTKTGKVRTIGLPSFLAAEIKTHLDEYGTSDAGHLFTSAEGQPVRHHNFATRHFRPAASAAGLPEGVRWHDLRHTCAALLIAAGRHLEEVRDQLGHSTIRVTSDTYAHLHPRARQAVADALDTTYSEARLSVCPGSTPVRHFGPTAS